MAGEKHILKINFKELKPKEKTALSRAANKDTLSDRKVASSVILDLDDITAQELLKLSQLLELCYKYKAEVSEFFGRDKILTDLSYITKIFDKYGLPEKFTEREKQTLQDIGKYYYGEGK